MHPRVTFAVAFIYVFYTIPIGLVSEVASQLVFIVFPNLEEDYSLSESYVEGWLKGQILNLFLAYVVVGIRATRH